MNEQFELSSMEFKTPAPAHGHGRERMNGKPVFTREAKSVINFESNFSHKLLCDGPTFSAGDACVYSCAFCYVPDLMRKLRTIPQMAHVRGDHTDIVVRRKDSAQIVHDQLWGRHGPKYCDPKDQRVIYSSPLVDVAGNMELVRETVEICRVILAYTNWQIRLLSKSNLLPKVAELLEAGAPEEVVLRYRRRVIYGVSTGTLDDGLAKVFEKGTPLVSKRIESLHWLQDHGYRTFGMACPSLPQRDYARFTREMAAAIRAERCEHVWAEVINVRGESFTRTIAALRGGGFDWEAKEIERAGKSEPTWESYARRTFLAWSFLPEGKLRFLQYAKADRAPWWRERVSMGAVLL